MPPPCLFLSHAWGKDELGRDAHRRAIHFAHRLKRAGARVWIDDDQLGHGHVDAAIADGIEGCPIFVALLTRAYCNKVHRGLREDVATDSCAKEWSCAVVRRRRILPVVFEPSMRDPASWPHGVVSLQVGGHMYIDASTDDAMDSAARALLRLAEGEPLAHSPPTPRVMCSLRRRSRRRNLF